MSKTISQRDTAYLHVLMPSDLHMEIGITARRLSRSIRDLTIEALQEKLARLRKQEERKKKTSEAA